MTAVCQWSSDSTLSLKKDMALTFSNGDILKTRLEFNGPGGRGYNVLYYRIITTPATQPALLSGLTLIGEAIYNHFKDKWKAGANVSASMLNCVAQSVYPAPRSAPVTYTPLVTTGGVITGEALPTQDSWTGIKRSRVGIRQGVGRTFFFGLSESSQTNGRIEDGATLIALREWAEALADEIIVSTPGGPMEIQPVVCGANVEATGTAYAVELGIPGDNIVKSQRRRRPGKGI